MPAALETLVLRIATAIAQQAGRSWLRRKSEQLNRQLNLVQLGEIAGLPFMAQRRLMRQFEQLADEIMQRLTQLCEIEISDVSEHERAAALIAVAVTLEKAELDDRKLFASDVTATKVRSMLAPIADAPAVGGALSEQASGLYSVVLKEAVSYLVEIVKTLPAFTNRALVEVLQRESQIISLLRMVLDRMPRLSATDESSDSDARFEVDYRRTAADKYDQMQIFGATLDVFSRRYSLSVAYVTLTSIDDGSDSATQKKSSSSAHGDTVLTTFAKHRRVLVSGEAGSGKTTLLRWLAVRSAEQSFDTLMQQWNDTVPFMIQLRNYADRKLPELKELISEAAWTIQSQMPASWVDRTCESGRALLLVDGIDELGDKARRHALTWVEDVLKAYPRIRCVITSRPPSVDNDWSTLPGIQLTHLQPMSPDNVQAFVRYWHEAVMLGIENPDDRRDLQEFERRLLVSIDASRALGSLATNPLLCALLCALNRDRRSSLPTDRMQIYRTALEMLLSRRDDERNVPPQNGNAADLTFGDKQAIVEDLAHWLTINNLVSAARPRVLLQFERSVAAYHLDVAPEGVYQSILLRSGLLRERDVDSVDFIHRTFQEYLAAKKVVDTDTLDSLLVNALHDTYGEVIVLAMGHARAHERDSFLRKLLNRAYSATGVEAFKLKILCVKCLETAKRLDPDVRENLLSCVTELVPPRSSDDVRALSLVGEDVLPLLQIPQQFTEYEAQATIQVAGLIATRATFPILRYFANDERPGVRAALVEIWPYFNAEEYAANVLSAVDFADGVLALEQLNLLPSVQHITTVREVHCLIRASPRVGELAKLKDAGSLTKIQIHSPDAAALAQLSNLTSLNQLEIVGNRNLGALRSLSRLKLKTLSCVGSSGGAEIGQSLDYMTELHTLELESINAVELSHALQKLRKLRKLTLHRPLGLLELRMLLDAGQIFEISVSLCSTSAVGRCSGNTSLRRLSLTNLTVLRSLDGIERLSELSHLNLTNCLKLEDISAIADCSNLTDLHLEVAGSGEALLSVTRHLHNLKRFSLVSQADCRLDPLAELTSLRELQFAGGMPKVDLRPFAGREGLRVVVSPWQKVLGSESLGATSSIATTNS